MGGGEESALSAFEHRRSIAPWDGGSSFRRRQSMIQVMLRVLALLAAGMTGTAVEPQSPPPGREVARPPAALPADEIVVVTASRREEQLRNAPATMSVVTGEKITHGSGQTVTD